MSGVITDMIDCPQCGLPAIKCDYYVDRKSTRLNSSH